MALKAKDPGIKIAIADPMGAALYSYYTRGGLKSSGSSITEGIGQGRITANLEDAPVDIAYQIADEEALPILFDLAEHEGLLLGGSSGVNVAGAICLAKELWARPHDRDRPLRFGCALSIETLQPGISAFEKFAGSGLDGTPAVDQTRLHLNRRPRPRESK